MLIEDETSTRADIVLIIAGLAVMGFTPGDAGPQPEVGAKKHVLVAIGDSYMSGEGADTYFEGTDIGGENQCRRAPTAWVTLGTHGRGIETLQS